MGRKADSTPSVLAIIFVFILIYYFGFGNDSSLDTNMNESANKKDNGKLRDKIVSKDYRERFDFVVKDNVCEIPRINPFSRDLPADRFPQYSCAVHPHLTRPLVSKHLINTTGRYILKINEDWKRFYVKPKEAITCCFREIERANVSTGADFKTNVLPCFMFQKDFVVPLDVNCVIVNCMRRGSKKVIFKDAFFFIQKRQQQQQNITDRKKIGVLLFGIDSISQINFRRRMPETYKYLRINKKDWYEMLGYNKLGYDAFPNLMSLLTGYNQTVKHPDCILYQRGNLDTCPFLWKQAQMLDMPTAFADDRTDIHTLTTDKVGFRKPPTDYYIRPYLLATEERLRLSAVSKLRKYCMGARFSANYILGYALDFALQQIGRGGLGLFWINSFRDSYEGPSLIQSDLTNYLNLLKMLGILESYVVILLSGNGMLHGPLSTLRHEFYEERLPILYISIPNAWKREHPDFVKALNRNRNRLVSPLDLHETIKHMLELGAAGEQRKTETPKPKLDCPRCKSLLKPIAENRSCNDAGIDWMWCSCEPFQAKLHNSNATSTMLQSLIRQMNNFLESAGLLNGTCYTLSLHKIYGVYNSQRTTYYNYAKFMTSMRNAEFEIGFWYDSKKSSAFIDNKRVNRLYDEAMDCQLPDGHEWLKKFCVCVEKAINTESHMTLTDGVTAVTAKN